MKVAFFSERIGGCYHYRTAIPFTALEEDGVEVLPLDGGDKFKSDVKSVQLARSYPVDIQNGIDFCKKENIKIVYDIDDATDLVDKTNYYYRNFNKETSEKIDKLLNDADIVTTTTEKMKEYLSKKTDKPIIIYPNCLDYDDWQIRKGKQDRLRIGFSGSMSHIPDLLVVLPAIAKLQKKYDFDFIIQGMGYEPYNTYFEFIQKGSTPELKDKLIEMDSYLKDINFEWIRWVDSKIHPILLRELNLDIGICPLDDREFNLYKSAVKFYEYSAVGTLTIVQDMLPYSEEPCILTKDWETTLEEYILNEEKRKEETTKQYEWVKSNRNVKDYVPLLKEIYL